MSAPEFDEFIDTLQQLKNCGGNYHFELKLKNNIQRTGKPIRDLTIREFLAIHEETLKEYNELMDRVYGQKKGVAD